MKMPAVSDIEMFAPCGMNCTVCYKHVTGKKHAKPCCGCLKTGADKPKHCQNCKIKDCANSKNIMHCFKCVSFPCTLINRLEKSYNQRYNESLVYNSNQAKTMGIEAFLEADRKKRTCKCGGAFSLHDNKCSECGLPYRN